GHAATSLSRLPRPNSHCRLLAGGETLQINKHDAPSPSLAVTHMSWLRDECGKWQKRDARRDVMAKNLLEWLPALTETERKEIVDAVRNHGPSRRVIDYNDVGAIGLSNREVVIAALLEVHRVYGTAAALDLARKLKGKP